MGKIQDATLRALNPNSRMGKIMNQQIQKMSVDKFNEIIYQCICICQSRDRQEPKADVPKLIQKALDVMKPEQCDEMIHQISILKKAKQMDEKKKEKKNENEKENTHKETIN